MSSAVALVLVLSVVGQASVRLSYQPEAPQCPDRAALEAAVSARLGYSPFDPNAARQAVVRLFTAGAGLQGSLQLFEGNRSLGRRSFSSPTRDCHELASSVALALAIALDPQSLEARPPPPTPPAPVVAPAPVVVEAPSPSPSPSPPVTVPLAVGIGLEGAVVTGLAPATTAGFGFQVSLRWRALEVTLGGRGDLPAASGGLRSTAVTGRVGLCGALRWLGLCAVGGGGFSRFDGPARSLTQGLGVAGGRLLGRFEVLPQLWLLPQVELLAVLPRVIALSGDEVLWASPVFSFNAALVVRYEFSEEFTPAQPKRQ